MNEEDFKAMDRKQAADDRKAYAQHLRITSSLEKKLLGLEPLLRGKLVTCRRLSALVTMALSNADCVSVTPVLLNLKLNYVNFRLTVVKVET